MGSFCSGGLRGCGSGCRIRIGRCCCGGWRGIRWGWGELWQGSWRGWCRGVGGLGWRMGCWGGGGGGVEVGRWGGGGEGGKVGGWVGGGRRGAGGEEEGAGGVGGAVGGGVGGAGRDFPGVDVWVVGAHRAYVENAAAVRR